MFCFLRYEILAAMACSNVNLNNVVNVYGMCIVMLDDSCVTCKVMKSHDA